MWQFGHCDMNLKENEQTVRISGFQSFEDEEDLT